MTNLREVFKTDTQYKRWIEYENFFLKIIQLQKEGKTIFKRDYNGEMTPCSPFVFAQDNQTGHVHLYEQTSKNSRIVWVGGCYDYDKKSCDYKYIHIETSLKSLKKEYKFMYFSNEVKL